MDGSFLTKWIKISSSAGATVPRENGLAVPRQTARKCYTMSNSTFYIIPLQINVGSLGHCGRICCRYKIFNIVHIFITIMKKAVCL